MKLYCCNDLKDQKDSTAELMNQNVEQTELRTRNNCNETDTCVSNVNCWNYLLECWNLKQTLLRGCCCSQNCAQTRGSLWRPRGGRNICRKPSQTWITKRRSLTNFAKHVPLEIWSFRQHAPPNWGTADSQLAFSCVAASPMSKKHRSGNGKKST